MRWNIIVYSLLLEGETNGFYLRLKYKNLKNKYGVDYRIFNVQP